MGKIDLQTFAGLRASTLSCDREKSGKSGGVKGDKKIYRIAQTGEGEREREGGRGYRELIGK